MGDIAALVPRAAFPTVSMQDWADMFSFGNLPLRLNTTYQPDREDVQGDYAGLALGVYRSNATVFAVELRRLNLFSQVEFKFQNPDGRLFTTDALNLLQHPEPGQTTQDLLLRALLYADFGGDVCIVRRRDRLRVLRPDWTILILGSQNRTPNPSPVDAELVGMIYQEGGPYSGNEPETFLRDEFAFFAPVPDGLMKYRGMPWPVPALRTIMGDSAATLHKLKFFENGATPNLVVTLGDAVKLDKAREWIELFEQDHKGVLNAYKTIYFGGGATAQVLGKDLQQADFKSVQGAGQTLIAASGLIHPTVAGLSEGLAGSSLNAGNFGQAKQLVGDTFLRPTWQNLCGSMEIIVPPPAGSRLWYDESRVSFLKEDIKDAAEVLNLKASAIRTLWDGGAEPDSVVAGVTSGDLSRVKHKYITVQVQPETPAPAALTAGPVEVRCTGTRKDGAPCGALIGKRTSAEPVGFETKCDRCGTMVAA